MITADTPLRGLTLTLPYPHLIAVAHRHPELGKGIETRSWQSDYRGWVAIHAALNLKPIGGFVGLRQIVAREPFRSALEALYPLVVEDPTYWLPRNCIVAVGRLAAICRIESDLFMFDGANSIPLPSEPERSFGNYAHGRYAWIFEEIRALRRPVRCTGGRSLWHVPPAIVAEVAEVLALDED